MTNFVWQNHLFVMMISKRIFGPDLVWNSHSNHQRECAHWFNYILTLYLLTSCSMFCLFKKGHNIQIINIKICHLSHKLLSTIYLFCLFVCLLESDENLSARTNGLFVRCARKKEWDCHFSWQKHCFFSWF